jgi:hypothetical protein
MLILTQNMRNLKFEKRKKWKTVAENNEEYLIRSAQVLY